MENASKALIIAGAILVSLVVISFGILIYKNMAGAVQKNANMTAEEIQAFNNKLTPYIGENISGSQVNALIQTARSINQNQDSLGKITIVLINTATGTTKTLLSDDNTTYNKVTTGKFYTVRENAPNGLISTINVTG